LLGDFCWIPTLFFYESLWFALLIGNTCCIASEQVMWIYFKVIFSYSGICPLTYMSHAYHHQQKNFYNLHTGSALIWRRWCHQYV